MKIKEESIIKPLPTDDTIEKFEKYWKVNLSNDYKVFLKNFGGGIPELGRFLNGGKEHRIIRFLCKLDDINGYGDLGDYDIDVVLFDICTMLTDDEDSVGLRMIPVALLNEENYLCIDFSNLESPAVCIWLNDESDDLMPAMNKVADSFEELKKMLY